MTQPPSKSTDSSTAIALQEAETEALLNWAVEIAGSKKTYFEIGQQLARRLGAHPIEGGLTEIGFWTPNLAGQRLPANAGLYLEVFTPQSEMDFTAQQQTVPFRYECIKVPLQGEFVWAVVSGMQVGTRDRLGSLYWLRYRDTSDGNLYTLRDVPAYSLPYGVFGPAELYDIEALQRSRADQDYLAQRAQAAPIVPAETGEEPALPREPAPVNILQVHIPTASAEGTLAGLTKIYRRIADKIRREEALTPTEQTYIGYEALQLLPTEPTIEFRAEDGSRDFFFIEDTEAVDTAVYGKQGSVCPLADGPLMITLRKPNTQNWGYDVPILGSSTTNPALLSTLRPDEVIDFIAELHNFPEKPIQVIYDLVYGHSDNQALSLLSPQFFAGPNMYGQDLSHTLPMVRAILIEMQRRKINTGIDGIRIDGGQDFKFFNPFSGRLEYDDNYLLAMSDVVQNINGHERLMFTIFEDGRPWPDEGWETTSTYRELIDLRPDAFQWGPLIFAHNTPALQGFWDYKWPRVQEVMLMGDRWITGCGNHDTVRRGNQLRTDGDINWNLGNTLPEVLNNAYDNPATTLWVYGFSPGLPMDFLNAIMHSGWGFFRNTDDLYGVKVVTEELGFLSWQVTSAFYDKPQFFKELKQLGFKNLAILKRFSGILTAEMDKYEFDLDLVALACRKLCLENDSAASEIPAGGLAAESSADFSAIQSFCLTLDEAWLKAFALAFMEDCHEFSRVSHFFTEMNEANRCDIAAGDRHKIAAADITPENADSAAPKSKKPRMAGNRADFNLKLRRYRQQHPWLTQNISGTDRFNRISEDGYTLFYGVRTQPDPTDSIPSVAREQIAILSHMGGKPAQTTLIDWLQLDPSEWKVVVTSPGLAITDPTSLRGLTLEDGQAVLLEKKQILT
ncbi:MAG: glucosylglycerol hydrolase [Cyanobacteria bacterium J06598_1]